MNPQMENESKGQGRERIIEKGIEHRRCNIWPDACDREFITLRRLGIIWLGWWVTPGRKEDLNSGGDEGVIIGGGITGIDHIAQI
jgi:hypothetical protein